MRRRCLSAAPGLDTGHLDKALSQRNLSSYETIKISTSGLHEEMAQSNLLWLRNSDPDSWCFPFIIMPDPGWYIEIWIIWIIDRNFEWTLYLLSKNKRKVWCLRQRLREREIYFIWEELMRRNLLRHRSIKNLRCFRQNLESRRNRCETRWRQYAKNVNALMVRVGQLWKYKNTWNLFKIRS